jgi:DNA mismatch endonuclease (patch repair protein)
MGLRFRVDWPLPGTRRRADLAFAKARVAVFVDGCFWHRCPLHATWPKANAEWWRAKIDGNYQRDRDTDARLTALGWRVMRFWEHEPVDSAARAVAEAVRRRQRPARNSGRE